MALAFPYSAIGVYWAFLAANPNSLATVERAAKGLDCEPCSIVAKRDTGAKPCLNHSTIDTERVRDDCAGYAAVPRHKPKSLAASSKPRARRASATGNRRAVGLLGARHGRCCVKRGAPLLPGEEIRGTLSDVVSAALANAVAAAARAAHQTIPSPSSVSAGHLATGQPVYK